MVTTTEIGETVDACERVCLGLHGNVISPAGNDVQSNKRGEQQPNNPASFTAGWNENWMKAGTPCQAAWNDAGREVQLLRVLM